MADGAPLLGGDPATTRHPDPTPLPAPPPTSFMLPPLPPLLPAVPMTPPQPRLAMWPAEMALATAFLRESLTRLEHLLNAVDAAEASWRLVRPLQVRLVDALHLSTTVIEAVVPSSLLAHAAIARASGIVPFASSGHDHGSGDEDPDLGPDPHPHPLDIPLPLDDPDSSDTDSGGLPPSPPPPLINHNAVLFSSANTSVHAVSQYLAHVIRPAGAATVVTPTGAVSPPTTPRRPHDASPPLFGAAGPSTETAPPHHASSSANSDTSSTESTSPASAGSSPSLLTAAAAALPRVDRTAMATFDLAHLVSLTGDLIYNACEARDIQVHVKCSVPFCFVRAPLLDVSWRLLLLAGLCVANTAPDSTIELSLAAHAPVGSGNRRAATTCVLAFRIDDVEDVTVFDHLVDIVGPELTYDWGDEDDDEGSGTDLGQPFATPSPTPVTTPQKPRAATMTGRSNHARTQFSFRHVCDAGASVLELMIPVRGTSPPKDHEDFVIFSHSLRGQLVGCFPLDLPDRTMPSLGIVVHPTTDFSHLPALNLVEMPLGTFKIFYQTLARIPRRDPIGLLGIVEEPEILALVKWLRVALGAEDEPLPGHAAAMASAAAEQQGQQQYTPPASAPRSRSSSSGSTPTGSGWGGAATPTNASPSILAGSSASGPSSPPSAKRKMSGIAGGPATAGTDSMVIQVHRAGEQSIILHVVKPPLDASKLAQAFYQLSQQVRQATNIRHAAIASGSPSAIANGPVGSLPLARAGSAAVTHTPPWTARSTPSLATVSEYPTTMRAAENPDRAAWSDMETVPTPLITRSESFSLLWGEPRNVRSITASPPVGAGTPGCGTAPLTGEERHTPTAYDESTPPVSPGAMPTAGAASGRPHPIPTRSTHEYRPSLVAREMTMGLARYRPVSPSPSAEVETATAAAAAAAAPGTPVADRTHTSDLVGTMEAAASASGSGDTSPTVVTPPGMVPSLSSLGPVPSPPAAGPTATATTTADLVQQMSDLRNYPSLPPLFRQTHSSPGRLVRVVPPIHVLIVEDNPINARILSAFMERRRIRYMLAGDGAQAVALFARHTFHIVLMDLQLPRMGGLEATQQIRAWERAHARGAWPSNQPTLQDLRRHLRLDRSSTGAASASAAGSGGAGCPGVQWTSARTLTGSSLSSSSTSSSGPHLLARVTSMQSGSGQGQSTTTNTAAAPGTTATSTSVPPLTAAPAFVATPSPASSLSPFSSATATTIPAAATTEVAPAHYAAASAQHVAAAVMQHAPLLARTSVPSIIVAITASQSTPEVRQLALRAGCNDFISKPVNLKWLESKIIEWGCIAKLIDFCTTEPAGHRPPTRGPGAAGTRGSPSSSTTPSSAPSPTGGSAPGPVSPPRVVPRPSAMALRHRAPIIPEVVPSVSARSGMHAAAGRGSASGHGGAGGAALHQYMSMTSAVAADAGKSRQRTSSDPESVLGMEQVAAVRRSMELHRSRTPST